MIPEKICYFFCIHNTPLLYNRSRVKQQSDKKVQRVSLNKTTSLQQNWTNGVLNSRVHTLITKIVVMYYRTTSNENIWQTRYNVFVPHCQD